MDDAPIPSATTLVLDLLTAMAGAAMSARDLCLGCVIIGHSEAAARVAITRLLRQGKILKHGRALYALNADRHPLQHDVGVWRARMESMSPWSGAWLAVDESGVGRRDRKLLRRHQRALALRGFQRWSASLYVRPDNLHGGVDAVRHDLQLLGLGEGAEVFLASGFAPGQIASLTALWDVEALAAAYGQRLSRIHQSEALLGRLSPPAAAREALLLGRSLIGQMLRDPLLPAELMQDAPRRALVAALGAYQTSSRDIWRGVLAGA